MSIIPIIYITVFVYASQESDLDLCRITNQSQIRTMCDTGPSLRNIDWLNNYGPQVIEQLINETVSEAEQRLIQQNQLNSTMCYNALEILNSKQWDVLAPQVQETVQGVNQLDEWLDTLLGRIFKGACDMVNFCIKQSMYDKSFVELVQPVVSKLLKMDEKNSQIVIKYSLADKDRKQIFEDKYEFNKIEELKEQWEKETKVHIQELNNQRNKKNFATSSKVNEINDDEDQISKDIVNNYLETFNAYRNGELDLRKDYKSYLKMNKEQRRAVRNQLLEQGVVSMCLLQDYSYNQYFSLEELLALIYDVDLGWRSHLKHFIVDVILDKKVDDVYNKLFFYKQGYKMKDCVSDRRVIARKLRDYILDNIGLVNHNLKNKLRVIISKLKRPGQVGDIIDHLTDALLLEFNDVDMDTIGTLYASYQQAVQVLIPRDQEIWNHVLQKDQDNLVAEELIKNPYTLPKSALKLCGYYNMDYNVNISLWSLVLITIMLPVVVWLVFGILRFIYYPLGRYKGIFIGFGTLILALILVYFGTN